MGKTAKKKGLCPNISVDSIIFKGILISVFHILFTFLHSYCKEVHKKSQKGKRACVQHNEKKDKEDHNVSSFKPNLIHLRISVLLSVFKVRQLFLYFVIIMGIFFPPLLHVAALLFEISIRSYRAG